MSCLINKINDIDTEIKGYIQMDNILPYGIATRQKLPNGKQVNFANNLRELNDGIFATWDDSYNMIWFHRINSSKMEQTTGTAVGRTRYALRETLDITMVVWCKSKFTHLGQTHEMTQSQLYRKITDIITFKGGITIKSVDWDMPGVAAREFTEFRTSKESILLSINYEITQTVPEPCFPCPPPECIT